MFFFLTSLTILHVNFSYHFGKVRDMTEICRWLRKPCFWRKNRKIESSEETQQGASAARAQRFWEQWDTTNIILAPGPTEIRAWPQMQEMISQGITVENGKVQCCFTEGRAMEYKQLFLLISHSCWSIPSPLASMKRYLNVAADAPKAERGQA